MKNLTQLGWIRSGDMAALRADFQRRLQRLREEDEMKRPDGGTCATCEHWGHYCPADSFGAKPCRLTGDDWRTGASSCPDEYKPAAVRVLLGGWIRDRGGWL